jgi:hypothetical protein
VTCHTRHVTKCALNPKNIKNLSLDPFTLSTRSSPFLMYVCMYVQGRSQVLGFRGAKLKKNNLGGAKTTNLLKNRGTPSIFSFFFSHFFFFFGGSPLAWGAQAPPSHSVAPPLCMFSHLNVFCTLPFPIWGSVDFAGL